MISAMAEWVFTEEEMEDLLKWLLSVVPQALDTFLHDHPEGWVDPKDTRGRESLSKRIRGQVRAQWHNLKQNRGLVGSVTVDGQHWCVRRRHEPRCGKCLLPSDHPVHRKCHHCGSPFHGQARCPERVPDELAV